MIIILEFAVLGWDAPLRVPDFCIMFEHNQNKYKWFKEQETSTAIELQFVQFLNQLTDFIENVMNFILLKSADTLDNSSPQ